MPARVDGATPATVGGLAGARDHRRGRADRTGPRHGRSEPADLAVARRGSRRPERPLEILADGSAPASRQAMSSQTWATTGGRGFVAIERVERGDAVGLRRRDRQPPADVVERRLADPADPVLDRVERREQLQALARSA